MLGKKVAPPPTNTTTTVGEPLTDEERRLCFPPLSEAWEQGLQMVEISDVIDRTFYFPDPEMFRAVYSMDRLRKYVAAWLTIRTRWLSLQHSPATRPQASATKNWKVFFMAFFAQTTDLKERKTKTAEDRRVLMDALKLQSIERIDPMNLQVNWNGRQLVGPLVDVIDPPLIREVVWELHELNFRWDLRSMQIVFDRYPLSDEDRDAFSVCFPRQGYNGWDSPPDKKSLGLADPSLTARAWATCHLNVLMAWPTQPISQEDLPVATFQSPVLCARVELVIAESYCTQFVIATRRFPVVPALWVPIS
jgi:hypothetical protein